MTVAMRVEHEWSREYASGRYGRLLSAEPWDAVLATGDCIKVLRHGRVAQLGGIRNGYDGILQRLKFSNDDREHIVHHVRHHLIPYEPGWSAAAIRRWVRRVGLANVPTLCSLGRADLAGKGTALLDGRGSTLDELEQRIATMQINQPIATSTSSLAISGKDVMATLGIGPGPRIGEELRRLLELVTETPEMNTREGLLDALADHQVR